MAWTPGRRNWSLIINQWQLKLDWCHSKSNKTPPKKKTQQQQPPNKAKQKTTEPPPTKTCHNSKWNHCIIIDTAGSEAINNHPDQTHTTNIAYSQQSCLQKPKPCQTGVGKNVGYLHQFCDSAVWTVSFLSAVMSVSRPTTNVSVAITLCLLLFRRPLFEHKGMLPLLYYYYWSNEARIRSYDIWWGERERGGPWDWNSKHWLTFPPLYSV